MVSSVLFLLAAQTVTPPTPVEAPPLTAASCDDPLKRKALLATDPAQLDVLQRLKEKSDANQEKMTKLVDRLGERAKWSDQQKGEFAFKLLDAPGLDAAMNEGMQLVQDMMKQLDFVVKSKDDAKSCRAVVDMMAMVPKVDANAQHQWDLMEAVVEAEAKRLGVSLN